MLTSTQLSAKHGGAINVVTMVTTSNSLRLRVVVDAGREASQRLQTCQHSFPWKGVETERQIIEAKA